VTESQPHRPTGTAGDRCPACGARVRPDDDWCSLCHRALREPAAAGDSVFEFDAVGLEPADPDADRGPAMSTAGLTTADAAPPARSGVDDVAARMLAELAVAESAKLPGPLATLRQAQGGGQLAIAAVGGAILLVLIMAALAVAGILL
jgi:hypothetical protein